MSLKIEERYSNQPDEKHQVVRYYCGKCNEELNSKKSCQMIQRENGQVIMQDIKSTCPDHPKAGFYVLFLMS